MENLIIDSFFGVSILDWWVTIIDEKNYHSICLNNSSLKRLTIKVEKSFTKPRIGRNRINVTADAGQNYFVSLSIISRVAGGNNRYYFVPLREYNKILSSSTKDKNWITCHIHCKSIEKLDIVFPTTETKNGEERKFLRTHTLLF